MTYHRDKEHPVIGYLVAGALIVLVLILVFLTALPRSLGTAAHSIGRIFWNSKEVMNERIEENARLISMSKRLLVDLAEVQQEELSVARSLAWESEMLRSENAELRSLLGHRDRTISQHAARIISRPPQSAYDRIVIDQGAEDGIVIGQFATAYGTVALGIVEEVYPHTAIIRLYSNANTESHVQFVTSGLTATAIGHGGGSYIIELPQSIEIAEGEQVIQVESGKLLGVVGGIDTDPREPFQQVYVRMPINIRYLDWLFLQ